MAWRPIVNHSHTEMDQTCSYPQGYHLRTVNPRMVQGMMNSFRDEDNQLPHHVPNPVGTSQPSRHETKFEQVE